MSRADWQARVIAWLLSACVALGLLVILSTLTGCAEFDAARAGVSRHGATAADAAMDVAKWQTCTAATIGSLERELAGDKARMLGWLLYCDKKPGHPLSGNLAEDAPQAQPQGRSLHSGPLLKE